MNVIRIFSFAFCRPLECKITIFISYIRNRLVIIQYKKILTLCVCVCCWAGVYGGRSVCGRSPGTRARGFLPLGMLCTSALKYFGSLNHSFFLFIHHSDMLEIPFKLFSASLFNLSVNNPLNINQWCHSIPLLFCTLTLSDIQHCAKDLGKVHLKKWRWLQKLQLLCWAVKQAMFYKILFFHQ